MVNLSCPYGKDWDLLVEGVGRFEAVRDYLEQDGVVRTPGQVLVKIAELRRPAEAARIQLIDLNDPSTYSSNIGLNPTDQEFHINTLNAVSKFLEAVGVEQRLVHKILDQGNGPIEGAIAAANFVKGTVDILDDFEKRPAAWNKLPEEAAHWWYRLLKNQVPHLGYTESALKETGIGEVMGLKKALWDAAKGSQKLKDLVGSSYNEVYSEAQDQIMDALTEEAIGQLISDAIHRIQTNTGSPKDYSFFKKFLNWLKRMVALFDTVKPDPFEVAAMKILSSDISDLLTFEEYKSLHDKIYIDNVLSTASLKELKTLQEVIDPQEYFFRELTLNKFRKRTRFLPKTLKKQYTISGGVNTSDFFEWSPSSTLSRVDITKKLNPNEKKLLENTNHYTNITPALKGLPFILEKFRKNPIAVKSELKIDGVKKPELIIYNSVLDLIRKENPDLKSISATDFAAEVTNYLQLNYLLGFGDEQSQLGYRIHQTFAHIPEANVVSRYDMDQITDQDVQNMTPAERNQLAEELGLIKANPHVQHRKISIRFNDSYFDRFTHFQYSPSAWGNLTGFYTSAAAAKTGIKDAVLLHEIQNDNIEVLRNLYKNTGMDLEESMAEYLNTMENVFQRNVGLIETGGLQMNTHFDTIKTLGGYSNQLLSFILQREYLSITGLYSQLMERADEVINLSRGNTYSDPVETKIEKGEKAVEEAYIRRRAVQSLIRRGGIRQILSADKQKAIEDYIRATNLVPGDIDEKRATVDAFLRPYSDEINRYILEYYGPDVKLNIKLHALGNSRTKAQKQARVRQTRLIEGFKQFAVVIEQGLLKAASRDILMQKTVLNHYTKGVRDVKLFTGLRKLTQAQFEIIFNNIKYNKDLLRALTEKTAAEEMAQKKSGDPAEKQKQIAFIQREYEARKEQAIKKKEKLGITFETKRAELSNRLDLEMNYFTPLVHQLIQTHIKEKGKDFPLYFSGFGITKLTQGSQKSSELYAGPEEVKAGMVGKVGALWSAMNSIPGVKLEYIPNISGFNSISYSTPIINVNSEKPGGYKINLDNYHYESPLLYSINEPFQTKNEGNQIEKRLLDSKAFSRKHGIIFVNQHSFPEAQRIKDTINRDLGQGTIKIVPVQTIKGAGGRTIFKAEITLQKQLSIAFNRESAPVKPIELDVNSINNARSLEIARKLAQQLSNQLGISYQFISSDQAGEVTKETKNPWKGELAFYMGGTVYFVGDKLTTGRVFHEFSHPFVRAIAKNNLALFNNLYTKVSSNADGQKVIETVKALYPEFTEDSTEFKEEVIVRSMEHAYESNLKDEKNTPEFLKAIKDILYAIKQLLRKMFGSKSKVEDLKIDTTIEDLAIMLEKGGEFEIDTENVSQTDVAAYIREANDYTRTLEQISGADIAKLSRKFYDVVSDQLQTLKNSKNYREMADVLASEYEPSELVNIKKNLTPFREDLVTKIDKLANNAVYQANHSEAFINSLGRLKIASKKMTDHIKKVADNPNNKDNLYKVFYYNRLTNYWREFTEEVLTTLNANGIDPSNSLYKLVSETRDILTISKNAANDVYTKGVKDVLTEYLKPLRSHIDHKYAQIIEHLEKKGASKTMIDKYKADYENLKLTPEKIEKLLKGELGDAHALNSYLEGYMQNQDPVVGGLAKYVNDNMTDVMTTSLTRLNEFMSDIGPDLRAMGYNPTMIGELGKTLTFVDTLGYTNQKGEFEEKKVFSFLNPHKNARLHVNKMKHDIEQAEKLPATDENKALVRKLRADYDKHLREFFNQKYVAEFYERYDLFESETGQEAYDDMQAARMDMNNFQEKYSAELDDTEAEAMSKALYRKMNSLYSLKNEDGSPKTGKDLEKAKILREYRQATSKFYERKIYIKSFLAALKTYEQKLIDQGYTGEDYQTKRMAWITKNTVVKVKPEFKAEVDRIMANIKGILKGTNEKVAEAYGDLFDIVNNYRDEDGQVNGLEMPDDMVQRVKAIEQVIDAEREKKFDLSKDERKQLSRLFEALNAMRTKVPTKHYLVTFNSFLEKMDLEVFKRFTGTTEINEENAEEIIKNEPLLSNLFKQSTEFKDWFVKNHREKMTFGEEYGVLVPTWERLYVWNVTKPRDPKNYDSTAVGFDAEGNPNEIIDRIPSFRFSYSSVKKEYVTKRVVGETIDNKGNYLPKTPAQGAPASSPYTNQEYYDLQKNDPKKFKVLEKMKNYHLKNQEGLGKRAKLWLDIPRYRKSALESYQTKETRGIKMNAISTFAKQLRDFFKKSKDDAERGLNYSKEDNIQMIYTDLFDDEVSSIPISGKYDLDLDQVSLDITTSLSRYMLSSNKHKKLVEMNPVARAMQSVLADPRNAIKDMTKINKANYLNNGETTYINKKGKNIRLAAVTNLIEREFEGQLQAGYTKDMKGLNQLSGFLFGRASMAFFALNLPSALKNSLAAHMQIIIEAAGGTHITPSSYGQGTIWATKAMAEISAQIYERGPKSLAVQTAQIFDAVKGYFVNEEKFAESMSRTLAKDVVDFSWLYNARKWTEMHATMSLFGGMMTKQKIKQTIGGSTKDINYSDAWELGPDGNIKLKEGIDPTWGQGGEEFKNFREKVNSVSKRLQGAYAAFDQPEAQRYLMFRMISFLRRYFTTMFMDRWAFRGKFWNPLPRYDLGTGELTQGFYVTALNNFVKTVTTGGKNLPAMGDMDRRAMIKMASEIVSLIALEQLYMFLFDWDPDDEERYEKLRAKSGALPFPFVEQDPEHPFHVDGWLANHSLGLMMQIRSENEQWVPVPGMGLDNYESQLGMKSFALGPTFDSYVQVLNDIQLMTRDDGRGYYKRDVGPYDWQREGSAKLWNHSAKSVGLTGTSIDPVVAIRNFMAAQNSPVRR